MLQLNNLLTDTNTNTIKQQFPLTISLLNDWSFITIKGIDAAKYLQNQLTNDIEALLPHKHILTAHCDAHGKIWSTLRLFHYKEGFGYILRTSVAIRQLNQLKKYDIFSKIKFTKQDNILLLGVMGHNANKALKNYFSKSPSQEESVINTEQTTILYFDMPIERFLIITNPVNAHKIIKYITNIHPSLSIDYGQQWLALDIAAGIANIDIQNINLFIPQAVNLQSLPGSISFTKGCYIGQETITRAKYRNANKRAMYWLTGVTTVNRLPKVGEAIEYKVSYNNWRSTGRILAVVKLKNNFISIQIVLNNNIQTDSSLRFLGDINSKLIIHDLPYSV